VAENMPRFDPPSKPMFRQPPWAKQVNTALIAGCILFLWFLSLRIAYVRGCEAGVEASEQFWASCHAAGQI
jgi:hypothetical protein